jgi:hypothetical protein
MKKAQPTINRNYNFNNPILASQHKPSSRALAIKAMCAHCMGCTDDHQEQGFRQSISTCTAPACPLYSLRPYRAEKSVEAEKRGVKSC